MILPLDTCYGRDIAVECTRHRILLSLVARYLGSLSMSADDIDGCYDVHFRVLQANLSELGITK